MNEQPIAEAPIARRSRGRPRKADIQSRPQPEMKLEPVREMRDGKVQVEGRGGVILSRKRTGNVDPYAIPQHIIPDGWDYQWNLYTVLNEPAFDSQILMAENGWRAVPAERHEGMFMPEGYKGQILRGGLRLEERPMALTLEARAEDNKKAVSQIRDQNAQLGMGTKMNLGSGHESRTFLGNGQAVRTGLDSAVDAPRPRLEIDRET